MPKHIPVELEWADGKNYVTAPEQQQSARSSDHRTVIQKDGLHDRPQERHSSNIVKRDGFMGCRK